MKIKNKVKHDPILCNWGCNVFTCTSVSLWKKMDGNWRVHWSLWNHDKPAPLLQWAIIVDLYSHAEKYKFKLTMQRRVARPSCCGVLREDVALQTSIHLQYQFVFSRINCVFTRINCVFTRINCVFTRINCVFTDEVCESGGRECITPVSPLARRLTRYHFKRWHDMLLVLVLFCLF